MLTQLREYKNVVSVRGVVGLEGKKRDVRKTICSCCAINRKTGLDFTYCAFSVGECLHSGKTRHEGRQARRTYIISSCSHSLVGFDISFEYVVNRNQHTSRIW